MKTMKTLAGSMVAVFLLAAPAVFAADATKATTKLDTAKMDMGKMGHTDEFMKSCDLNGDGKVSKAEMMAHMEKMFDKMDTKKTGKLDKKKTEEFLKQLTAPSGG